MYILVNTIFFIHRVFCILKSVPTTILKIVSLLLTVTLHALVDEAIEQRAAVIAKRRAPVGVDLELMLRSGILQEPKKD